MEIYFRKKYLNESIINFDKKLLKNLYLNKGYFDVDINSSFAKLLESNEFELIFNIEANEKFFDSLTLDSSWFWDVKFWKFK